MHFVFRYIPPPQFSPTPKTAALDGKEIWLIQIPSGVGIFLSMKSVRLISLDCYERVNIFKLSLHLLSTKFSSQIKAESLNGTKFKLKNNKVVSLNEVCFDDYTRDLIELNCLKPLKPK